MIAVIWTKEDKVIITSALYKLNSMKLLTLILLSIHHTASADVIAKITYIVGISKHFFLYAQQTI